METLIRLSSTLSSQIKELGVKVTARDVRTKGVNGTGRVDPALSFSACVLNVAVGGEVFFEPNDSLHSFIQQIEDTIIHSLLEKISITELPSVSGFFVSEAARFHTADLTACIYSTSPLATIRSSIRIIASHDIGHMKEHLESIFLGISSFIEKKMILLPESSLRGLNFSSSVNELSRKQLCFAPLDNDPFAEVLHCRLSPSSLSCPPASKGSTVSKPRSTVLAIRVEHAGSEQVHGLYSLSTTLSKAKSLGVMIQNPVYQNSDGYLISCHEKEVCLSAVNSSSHFDADKNVDGFSGSFLIPLDSPSNGCNSEPDSSNSSSSSNTLYRWVISNPSLDCKYYTCSTMEPSPLPPAMGWKSYGPSCQGKLPGPHLVLTIVDDESPGDSDSGASEPEDDDSRPEAADTANTAAAPAKGTSTKTKKTNKGTRKDSATALVSTSFSPCLAKLPSTRRDSVENDSCNTLIVQDPKHKITRKKMIEKRLCVPNDEPVESDVASPWCAVNEKASIKSIQQADSPCEDQHLSAFSAALELIKSSHRDRAESSRAVLQMCMKQLQAAEMLHSSRVREICERQAWLTEVTNTDELLEGFPSHMDVVNDDDHMMEDFSAEWDLKSAVSRVSAACLMTQSNCSPVPNELSADTELEASDTAAPVTANMEPALVINSAPVTADVHITQPAGVVRKVTSLPSFKDEGRSHDKGHRRSQSQTQSQSQSHSIFQWPEDDMPPPSANFSTDNDHYRQLPSWTDGSLVTNSLKRSTSQLQWPPSITESSPTNIGAALCTPESSEIPVPINTLATNKSKSDYRSEPDGEWDGDGEGSASCFESLLNAISPAEQQCLSYSIVDVIGIQMRVPQSSSNGNGSAGAVGASPVTNGASAGAAGEKAHYVIRISLRDSGLPRTVGAVQTAIRTHSNSGSISSSRIRIPLSPPSITIERQSPGGSAEGTDCNDGFTDEPSDPSNVSKSMHPPPSLSIIKNSTADQQGQSNSRRHSMAGLRPTSLFSRQVCTVRKDLTSLFLFHAQLSDLLLAFKDNTIVPPPFPDPFLIANFEEGLVVCSAQQVGSFSRQMRPQKKADLFAYSSNMKSQNLRVKEAMDCPGLDRTLHDIQQYLRSIFLLVENIDSRAFRTEDDQNLPRDRCFEGIDDRDLVASLGKLIGSLLISPEHEDKNQIRPTHAVLTDLLPSSAATPASAPLRVARKPSDAPAPAPSTQEKINFKSRYKACWRPYITSGLKMRLNLCDDQGGRLSMKSDEELLRAQGGKCAGCGEPISAQWGFLGLDRNYQPCRFYGGLFCRKWCHGNDRRQIPHRLLLHWDHRAHRVSKQAARFLDMLWSQPVLIISSANPLLYEGVPALRLTRNMRGRVVQLIKRVLTTDTCPEKSDVRDVIMAVLGAEQAHLCLSKELYSIADLVGVQNGDLLASLEALIGMLRDMDRTLGVA